MGHGTKADKNVSRPALILGSGTAGVLELFCFHPVDTIAKRLMSNQQKLDNMASFNKVIFKDAAAASASKKMLSLFPGISFALGYKVSQRVYKFGGQAWAKEKIDQVSGNWFRQTFGPKWGKSMMEATAGSLIGAGEVVLLPLDVLKIKSQTNPEAMANRSLGSIIFSAGGIRSLYAGTVMTAMRNIPGSFALFGGNAMVKEHVFHLQDHRQADFYQNTVGSLVGALLSITVASPMDVVKTRIQNKNFGEHVSGLQVVGGIIRDEGFSAFFKGLTPKVLTVGPKLVFSFTVAQTLITVLDRSFKGNASTPATAAASDK